MRIKHKLVITREYDGRELPHGTEVFSVDNRRYISYHDGNAFGLQYAETATKNQRMASKEVIEASKKAAEFFLSCTPINLPLEVKVSVKV